MTAGAPGPETAAPAPSSHGRYGLLLASLIALGVLYPAVDVGRVGLWLWTLSAWVVLFGAVRACAMHPHEQVIAGGLFVLLVVLALAQRFVPGGDAIGSPLSLIVLVLHLAFFGWTMRVILLDVLRAGRVTTDTICGAASFYLLLGVFWSYAFEFVYELDTSSITELRGAVLAVGDEATRHGAFLYMSFVTLTTLGYGDMLPTTPLARLLTGAEAVVGQLYLTVLVARLVGLHISASRD